jgi:hypothetical protein
MISNPNHAPVTSWRVVSTGLCLGLCLSASAEFARAQDSSAIIVKGQAAKPETPFACTLEKSLTKDQRDHKKQITLKMAAARIDTKELADGYIFRFRPDVISFEEIADWVATERVCCPFFDLAVEAERENGPLSLRITGRDGVKQFIRGEFHVLKLG